VSLPWAHEILREAAIPVAVDLQVHDPVLVQGFPLNASSARHETVHAAVVDLRLPLPHTTATGIKLYSPQLAAVEPVNPRGMSGGPVLKLLPGRDGFPARPAAVALVIQVPTGTHPLRGGSGESISALGAGLVATAIADLAASLPEVADALLASVPLTPPPRPDPGVGTGGSLTGLLRADAQVVRFFGRDTELAQLHSWCTTPAAVPSGTPTPGAAGASLTGRAG
jgi:hypothetical protein